MASRKVSTWKALTFSPKNLCMAAWEYVGEQVIPIEHCLLALPGTKMEEIKRVYSHPQSLMQSARYLAEHDWQQISSPTI